MTEVEAEEPIRIRTRALLAQVFTTAVDKEDDKDEIQKIILDKITVNLEKGVFNSSIHYAKDHDVIYEWSNRYFVTIYKDKVRSIYENLKQTPSLCHDIMNKKMLAHEIAFMTHMELKPEIWVQIMEQWEFTKKQELECTVESMTDTFQCRKCHSRKTTYYQMQTRSADEPMTVFVSCLVCGTRWKC